MSFITDKQTLDDLSILGKKDTGSIFFIFNRTRTRGGAEILEQMFSYPLSDAASINRRSSTIQYFASAGTSFPFETELFDTAEQYLENTDERTQLTHEKDTMNRRLNNIIGADTEFKQISNGVSAVLKILNTLHEFICNNAAALDEPYGCDLKDIQLTLADPLLDALCIQKHPGKLSYSQAAGIDKALRFSHRDMIKKLLHFVYLLDVYISVAAVANLRKFVFPRTLSREEHTLRLEGVYHPELKNAVGNKIDITPDSNIVFLTGANMAGKSTFMKALGIAVFLAHMGFPVAAEKMEFSVRDGIFTTINLPDNLIMGYSHFYAEVLRVKKVAEQLGNGRDLFIIFDELFRGTNVKDAYEATIALTAGFAHRRKSMFVISTHIIEAGDVLKKEHDNISFTYFPTLMNGSKPVYTYTLRPGITEDRHGMIIINNEGIIDILRKGKMKTTS